GCRHKGLFPPLLRDFPRGELALSQPSQKLSSKSQLLKRQTNQNHHPVAILESMQVLLQGGRTEQERCVEPGILEIFAVSQGIVGIRGVFSNKFLAMSKKGKLHASARFTADCQFRERFQENSYNTYASAVHRSPRSGRQWYVALNKRGKAKRGCSPRARPQHVSTHFLPRFWQPQPPELFVLLIYVIIHRTLTEGGKGFYFIVSVATWQ
uniref:Fibroblast growth factor n=1 Tax=Otus sunia TaxID=257818 RepID=A0A8C8AW10_9STRI